MRKQSKTLSPLKRDCQFSGNPRLGSRGGGQYYLLKYIYLST